jgi:hypothetical protein
LISGVKMVFQSSFMLTTAQPLATVTFPVLSVLDSFRAPADWTRESFNFEIGVRLA